MCVHRNIIILFAQVYEGEGMNTCIPVFSWYLTSDIDSQL